MGLCEPAPTSAPSIWKLITTWLWMNHNSSFIKVEHCEPILQTLFLLLQIMQLITLGMQTSMLGKEVENESGFYVGRQVGKALSVYLVAS